MAEPGKALILRYSLVPMPNLPNFVQALPREGPPTRLAS
ncbi:hypothetical protein THTE_4203 [Thermogutta terrifontis]|uniref:Uncharacterized protein n=1 Tax=Thermogutta terrifontis TaxID=1331910 RepID=A0A286RLG2_9BACT|nr:hypothetical protein THTE_4203 [Thermogutta terrifontis]